MVHAAPDSESELVHGWVGAISVETIDGQMGRIYPLKLNVGRSPGRFKLQCVMRAIYTYSYICPCTHIVHVHTYICPCTHAHMSMYTCTYVHAHMYICPCTHIHMSMYTCTYVHVHMYICPCTHAHMSMYTCTYVHVHMYICPCT